MGPRGVAVAGPFLPPGEPPSSLFSVLGPYGTDILLARRQAVPAASEHWRRQGLSPAFLEGFWRRIWQYQQSRHSVVFQWLVAHRGWLLAPGFSLVVAPRTARVAGTRGRHSGTACGIALLLSRFGPRSSALFPESFLLGVLLLGVPWQGVPWALSLRPTVVLLGARASSWS